MAEVKDKIVTVESLKVTYDALNECKAPSGFGLGENTIKYFPTSESEFNTMLAEAVNKLPNESVGFFTFVDNNGVIFNGGTAHATVYRANNLYTTVTFVKYHYTDVVKFVKTLYDGTWLPLTWENPPMTAGVEYRTTEKHKGLPVYVKLIDIATLPNSASASTPTNISGFNGLVSIDGAVMSGSSYNPISSMGNVTDVWLNSTGTSLSIKTNADLSNRSASVYIKYTKSN